MQQWKLLLDITKQKSCSVNLTPSRSNVISAFRTSNQIGCFPSMRTTGFHRKLPTGSWLPCKVNLIFTKQDLTTALKASQLKEEFFLRGSYSFVVQVHIM